MSGTCPPLETDGLWPTVFTPITWLLEALRCPSLRVYLLALSTYSATGAFQLLVHKRNYCAECGLLAVLASLLAGVLYGAQVMLDALVLGGFLSLLCSKAIGGLVGDCRRRRSWEASA